MSVSLHTEKLFTTAEFSPAAMGKAEPIKATSGITIWPLVPVAANQGWKLELFKINEPIAVHYHEIQRQILIGVQGETEMFCTTPGKGPEFSVLQPGGVAQINPGTEHSLVPRGETTFLAFDLPGFEFHQDVFYDASTTAITWSAPSSKEIPVLDERPFAPKGDLGTFAVYGLVDGTETAGKWSAALLEIQDSPRHFHKLGAEHFIVANGVLDIEIDGVRHVLEAGQSVIIQPNQVHHLMSANKDVPVRVVCVNFPAFNPEDMYCC